MTQITFLKDWDRFKTGDTRIIEPTLAARLILSGTAIQTPPARVRNAIYRAETQTSNQPPNGSTKQHEELEDKPHPKPSTKKGKPSKKTR